MVSTSGRRSRPTRRMAAHPASVGRSLAPGSTCSTPTADQCSRATQASCSSAATGVAAGYLNRPTTTAERFVADPFTAEPDPRPLPHWRPRPSRTGRRGALPSAAWTLRFRFRGQRVELDEVAATLTTHPTVRRCAVIARESDHGNLQIVAYVVPTNAASLDRGASFVLSLATWLPQYMIPTAFVQMDTLPVTANGKLDCERAPAPRRALVVRPEGADSRRGHRHRDPRRTASNSTASARPTTSLNLAVTP